MKQLKIIGLVLLVVIVVLQFFPPKYNHSTIVTSTDFVNSFKSSDQIAQILHTSCYNCHSNNTIYPWYNKVQPIGWLLENHINTAKRTMNFSEFGSYSIKDQQNKLNAIVILVQNDKMPLPEYALMHPEARLSKEKKNILIDYMKTLEK